LKNKKFVVLLGAPGAGKGTQSKVILEHLQLSHLSTGDLFRHHIKNNTDLGKQVISYLQHGELVPDEITIDLVEKALQDEKYTGGALLDGFPRNIPQAEALSKIAENVGARIMAVLIDVPEEKLVFRISGRLTCQAQGHTYHKVFKRPQVAGVCDLDGSELYQREDDKEELVSRRVWVYTEQTKPLLDFYQQKGLLKIIDGNRPVSDVAKDVLNALKVN